MDDTYVKAKVDIMRVNSSKSWSKRLHQKLKFQDKGEKIKLKTEMNFSTLPLHKDLEIEHKKIGHSTKYLPNWIFLPSLIK